MHERKGEQRLQQQSDGSNNRAVAQTTERQLKQQSGGSHNKTAAQNADEPALNMNQSLASRCILSVGRLDFDRILDLRLSLRRRRRMNLLLGGRSMAMTCHREELETNTSKASTCMQMLGSGFGQQI